MSRQSKDVETSWVTRFVLLAAALAVAFVVTSCEEPLPPPVTARISGRLTQGGQPLSPGHGIVFINDHSGDMAYGLTDAEGNFQMNAVKKEGIVPGRYRVYLRAPSQIGQPEERPMADPTMEQREPEKPVFEFPDIYLDHQTSGLQYKINVGDNDVTIDLPLPTPPETDAPPASNSES